MTNTSMEAIRFCDTIEEVERKHILHVLELSNGNRTLTAKRLDIGVRTLQRKLKGYGLPPGINQWMAKKAESQASHT